MRRKEEQLRLEGMQYAVRFLLTHERDVDALIRDADARGALRVPLSIDKEQEEDFVSRCKQACMKAVCMVAIDVLRKEYGFGKVRLERFISAFNDSCGQVADGYVDIYELVKKIESETGLDSKIRW